MNQKKVQSEGHQHSHANAGRFEGDMSKMKVGQKVRVYQMWITQEGLEGEAELVKYIGMEDGCAAERWWVTFPEDGDGSTYMRTVWPEGVLT